MHSCVTMHLRIVETVNIMIAKKTAILTITTTTIIMIIMIIMIDVVQKINTNASAWIALPSAEDFSMSLPSFPGSTVRKSRDSPLKSNDAAVISALLGMEVNVPANAKPLDLWIGMADAEKSG